MAQWCAVGRACVGRHVNHVPAQLRGDAPSCWEGIVTDFSSLRRVPQEDLSQCLWLRNHGVVPGV